MMKALCVFVAAASAMLSGCGGVTDVVFETVALADAETIVVQEDAGYVEIELTLSAAPRAEVRAVYDFQDGQAQSTCQTSDYTASSGVVTWPAGERVARVPLLVHDDALAELDEDLKLVVELTLGARPRSETLVVQIADDDRTALIDPAAEYGVTPNAGDQSAKLQAALDVAGASGRGVVVLARGDYELSSVAVPAGTTLSGRGARLLRPRGAAADLVSVRIAHQGALDSDETLVEGIAIHGRRHAQGAYEADERAEAHLLAIASDPADRGRLRADVQEVTLHDGTGSGVFIGPQSDVRLCRVRGADLWRDLVTLRGGGSRVDLRQIDATATRGTTGMWFDGQPAGFAGTHAIEVHVRDAVLASGDFEIEAYAGSRVEIERLSMLRAPFRLHAPDATVRITHSTLQLGLPRGTHNGWSVPHDVEVRQSTLVATTLDEEATGANGELAAVFVRWQVPTDRPDLPPLLPFAAGPHRLLFEGCTFTRAAAAEQWPAFGVRSEGSGGAVILRGATFDTSLVAPLSPSCDGCELAP